MGARRRKKTEKAAKSTAPLAGLSESMRPIPDRVEVDPIDMALLRELAANSRVSQRQLSRAVNMSAPAVAERLARLETSGVIQRYTIDVDWAKLGYPVVIYLPITAVSGSDIGKLVGQLIALPEVENVDVVSGSYDLVARLRVRDHRHLSDLLLNEIWKISTVERTETLLSLATAATGSFALKLFEQLAGDS